MSVASKSSIFSVLSFIWELLNLELEWLLNGCDSWNHTLPSLGLAQQADRLHDMENSLSSLCPAEVTEGTGTVAAGSCPAQQEHLLCDCPTCPGDLAHLV